MKFIITNLSNGKVQSITRECVNRIKGKTYVDSLIGKIEKTGNPIEIYFDCIYGDSYDLKIENETKTKGEILL